ncbi:MAG: DUF6512 family protein [Anaerolineae bacterium]|jgi:flagellar biosynthesis protein FliQ|nr:DUF6512 family protein [Anaerolineae bacterium]
MPQRDVRVWETAGVAFILVAGAALHFAFAWSGYWRPIAWLAAVNESLWEHLKLAFWPAVAFALAEYVAFGSRMPTFWAAKGVGIALMPAVIVGLFYAYTAVLGDSFLPLDILIFIAAAALGQWVSYRLLFSPRPVARAAAILPILLALAFVLFSYRTPHIGLFRDSPTGTYGILEKYGTH